MSRAGMRQLSLLRASSQCLSTRTLATAARWPIARSAPVSPTLLGRQRSRPFSTTRPRRNDNEEEEDSSYSEADHEHAVISTFDLFSIGIGPSSSHTVGPMRAGNIFVNDLIDANLLHKVNKIRVAIYGSLALTGEGHMTPSALLLGLEGADVETIDTGYVPSRFDDIKASKKIYLGRGLSADGSKGKEIDFDYEREFIWEWGRKLPQHSNGMRFTVYDKEGYVLATNDMFSVGGGFVVNGALSIAPQETLSPNGTAQLEAANLEQTAHPADLAENMYYKEIRRSDAAGDRRTGTEVKALDEASEGPSALLGDSPEPTAVSADVKSETKSTSSSPHPRYPFRDAASLLSLCRKHNLTIAQLVYENEKSLGYTDEDIYRKIFKIWGVMDASILESVQAPTGSVLPGSLKLHRRAPALYRRLTRGLYPSSAAETSAAQLEHKFSSPDPSINEDGASSPNALAKTSNASVPEKFMPGGMRKRGPPRIHGSLNHPIAPAPSRRTTFPTMDYLSVYAIAVNETNAGGGRIVTAPTNGAAGIIPAVLKYTNEFISDDPERDIPTFLLTAAAIGMLYKRGATISAAEGGCMAEVGVACSMAAGAFAACMGASPETIEQAAEIGIEHNLGLTCDPIGGLVQAPCIERNALGATKAISSANLALSSETGTQRVRLDDAIRAMRLTAKGMRNEFKETSLSGLATSVHINIPNISTLPTRVIDISSVEQGYVRLVEAEDTEHGRYTALSYCWGSQASVKTEIENIEMMKSGIAVKDLPLAYQDAIALTRELGIGYIWIDALCIIQNSQRDWEKECSKMAETYANAYLTIAAASSASVMEHFLRPGLKSPPHTTQSQRVIHSESMQSVKGPVLLKARTMRPTGAHWKWRDGADEQRHVEPLSTRGWTLQEKVLSTRLLSVSAMEMVWTCKERIFCECGSLLNYHREFGQTPLSQISKPDEAFNFWHKVVENYSKRKLTQVGDKLPAISAIAAIIQQRTGSDYVAGLWRDSIDQELLWYRPASSPVGTANSLYTSPSFSWASITGEVDYLCFRNGKYPYEKTSQVLELTSSTGPGAPLGRVSSSKLVIRGPLAMGYVERQPQHSISIRMGKKLLWFCVNLGKVLMWFHPDTALSKTVIVSDGVPETSSCRWSRAHNGGDLLEELESLDQKQPIGHAHHHLTDGREGDSGIRCWVMRLGGYHLRDGEMDYEYLVLGKSPSQPEFFERLGLGMMMSDDDAADKIFAQENAATITIV
ncbi:hypothetical protein FAVG1_09322 [Fusarium avenaceum]|nr:hypothetical protein FAVG1_09322 [Fusarium avenaceum]